MLLSDFIRESTRSLEALYPGEEARSVALLLCCRRLGVKSYTHIIEPGYSIDEGPLLKDMQRLLAGEPIQYVLGTAAFCGRDFKVGPGILVPRPETEQLVMIAEEYARDMDSPRVLDLCTGSGCIAWTIALDIPGSIVSAVDISSTALETARIQFECPGPSFFEADILGEPDMDGQYDIITANPPYVTEAEKPMMRRNVLDFEPETALFVPDSDPLLFYRAIAVWAERLLVSGGLGIVEINELFGEDTMAVFRDGGFSDVRVVKDLFGKDRFVSFRK